VGWEESIPGRGKEKPVQQPHVGKQFLRQSDKKEASGAEKM
jgi:hypothetical protein